MSGLFQDIRYGIRMLYKTPLVTVVAVVTLAVGIGATSAIFQFVDAGLVHAVPYREPDRDPDCDLNFVLGGPQKRRLRVTLSNSFGFGGSNNCVVLRHPDEVAATSG